MKIKFLIILFFGLVFSSCVLEENDIPTYEKDTFSPFEEELKQTSIPIVKIEVSDGQDITSRTEWKNAEITITGDFCDEDDLKKSDIKIKGRGNSSWDEPKKSYTIKFSSKTEVLGMPKEKKWVLIANYSDKTLLRNYFISKLGNNVFNSVWNPSFKSVHLFLNERYRGVYLIGESILIDKNRVNIKDISKADKNKGGFIFEIDQRNGEKINFRTAHNVCINIKDPDDLTDLQTIQNIKDIIFNAEAALFSEDFCDSENGYKNYFDIDSVVDWYLINELSKNVDAPNFASIYFYYNPEDKLIYMGPNWDFDRSCGNVNYKNCDSHEGLYIKDNSVWINRMFEDPEFEKKVKIRWNEKKCHLYKYINKKLKEYANELEQAASFNFSKWQVLGHYIEPNCDGFEERLTYQDEIEFLIDWLQKRYFYLDEQFRKIIY